MALSLLTNISSVSAQYSVNKTQASVDASIARLSSGMRINHASDDAAGLAISTQLSSEIIGVQQAQRNANDGISMLQLADGALGEINGLLTRMKQLAIESSNSVTLTSSDRGDLNAEYSELLAEISRIVSVTTFNGQNIIDGTFSSTSAIVGTNTLQVGTVNNSYNQIFVTIANADVTSATNGVLNNSDINTTLDALYALNNINTAINNIATNRATIGASQNRLNTASDNLSNEFISLSAANSRILDTDIAQESSTLARNQILLQAGIAVLVQANQEPQSALPLVRG